MKIYFDGGCRPNPGAMELAVVVRGRGHYRGDAGQGSSMDAEWLALLYALEIAASLGLTDLQILGDALSVVNQARGLTKCRSPEMQGYREAFDRLAFRFERIRIRHVGRSQNLAGIALDQRRSGL